MLYQRVMGDFSPINSEGKFTLSRAVRLPYLYLDYVLYF